MEKLLTDEGLCPYWGGERRVHRLHPEYSGLWGAVGRNRPKGKKEALTGIGLDEFKSGYVLLSDLDSTNEEFADNFEKYLQKAIFSSLIANKYKDEIESLYKPMGGRFRKWWQAYSGGS